MPNNSTRLDFTYDSNLVLKDPGLVAASGIMQVNGKNQAIDVGLSEMRGWGVVDVSAIEVNTGDELYTLIIQGALRDPTSLASLPVPLAGSFENLAELDLGHTAVRKGGAITSLPGQYLIPFRNVQNDIIYPILRGYLVVAGTIATGINFSLYIGKGLY